MRNIFWRGHKRYVLPILHMHTKFHYSRSVGVRWSSLEEGEICLRKVKYPRRHAWWPKIPVSRSISGRLARSVSGVTGLGSGAAYSHVRPEFFLVDGSASMHILPSREVLQQNRRWLEKKVGWWLVIAPSLTRGGGLSSKGDGASACRRVEMKPITIHWHITSTLYQSASVCVASEARHR